MPTQPYNPYFMNRGNDPDQDQVALFIDWDNLVISNYADRGANRPNIEVIIQKAQQYGTVVIARAYAEWTVMIDRLEVYKTGVEPIYAPVFHSDRDLSGQMGKGKSLADPVMVADCIDFLHLLPQVGTYVLVTGDKDMMPVVRLAKLRGRRVVVIGPDYVANVLQQVCDEFVPYRMLLAAATQVDPYAAYYQPQQPGAYYPPQQQPQPGLPQGYYPPQMPQSSQSGNDSRSRTGRRLSSGRRTNAPQPYKDVSPPQQPPMQQQAPYGYYYGAPQMMPPQGYPGSAAPQGYPPPPAPGYPEAQANPVGPQQYPQPGQSPAAVPPQYQPTQQPQQYQPTQTPQYQPGQTPQQYQPPAAVPQQYQPTQQPQQYQPAAATPVTPQAQPAPARPAVVPTPLPAQAQVTPPVPALEQRPSNNFEDVKEVIRAIMGSRATNGRGQMRARDLKEELLRRIPSFSERRYGYSKFKALLNAVEQAGILQMYQSGHILWVAAPGTPKGEEQPEFDEPMLNAAGAVVMDELEDDEEDEEEESESGAELSEEFDAATPVMQTQAPTEQRPTVIVEPGDALLEGAVQAPEQEERYMPTPAAEERVTALAEAPIGAHSQRDRDVERRPAQAEPAKSGKAPEKIPGLGARPALLEQPYYEDVIVLVEGLRHRNRWLGYELLLSSVRDYLTKHMSESEAKSQAGAILSKLLNENVLKMAMEVHSRGARKMRVQVAHLQEEHPAVRYAMGAAAARATMATQAEQAATAVAEAAATETQPEMTATLPEGQAPTETGEAEQPQAANVFSSPDAQTFEAVAEIVADKAEVTLAVDEGGVPVIQTEAPQGEVSATQPELSAAPSVQAESEAAPFIEAHTSEHSHEGAEPIVPEAQSLQFGEQTQMEGETGQIPQNPEMLTLATDEAAEVPQPDRGEEFHPQGSGEEQPQFVQTVEAIPVVEAGGEAGDLGHDAEVTPVEQVHDPVPEVTQEQHDHSPEQHDHHQHDQPHEEHDHAPEQHDHQQHEEHDHSPEQHDHAPEQHDHQQHEHGSEQHHEPSSPEQHHEQWAVTGEEVTAQVVETPGAEGKTGQNVQGEPEHAPPGEDAAPAGGYMNTVALATPEAETVEANHTVDGAESEDESEETEEEHGAEPIAPGIPPRPRRRRRTPRPTNPVGEGAAELMGQPRERRYRNSTRRPARQPRQPENKRRPTNSDESREN